MGDAIAGQVILITGASSGLGRESALRLAAGGARLGLCDLDEERGEALATELREAGSEARFYPLDVRDGSRVSEVITAVTKDFGALNTAINSAGVDHPLKRLDELDEDDFDRVLGINLKGLWFCMRAQLRLMKTGGGGHIINIASVAGLAAAPLMGLYGASKFGVVGLTRTAAVEYARYKIRANAVCPAVIRTPMVERQLASNPAFLNKLLAINPMRRMGEPREVASLIAWLCGEDASFMNGQAIAVDGGLLA